MGWARRVEARLSRYVRSAVTDACCPSLSALLTSFPPERKLDGGGWRCCDVEDGRRVAASEMWRISLNRRVRKPEVILEVGFVDVDGDGVHGCSRRSSDLLLSAARARREVGSVHMLHSLICTTQSAGLRTS
jgi:hypothetical protein